MLIRQSIGLQGVEAIRVRLGLERHVRHPPEQVAPTPPHELNRLGVRHEAPEPVQGHADLPVAHQRPAHLGGHPLGPAQVEDEEGQVADREALGAEGAGSGDQDEAGADVLDVGEDGIEAFAEQDIPKGRALALGIELVEAVQHPVLGVGHLDRLGRAEHLSYEAGHVPGRLPALLPVLLYPLPRQVDYEYDYKYGDEDAEGHNGIYARHDVERRRQEEHVRHEELELRYVLGNVVGVVPEAADGLARRARQRAVPWQVHQVGEGVALQHRGNVEVTVVMEHHTAKEQGECEHTYRDQYRAQLPNAEGDARLARELVEYLALDEAYGVLQHDHPEYDGEELGEQGPLQGPGYA